MHGSPWPYDARIPFFFYGNAFVRPGVVALPVNQQDMAPTLAALLGVSMPATSVGRPMRSILLATKERPRAIVLAVLDGMRVDYFERYRKELPTLDRLRRGAAWFSNAQVNYLPAITALAHATLATGADPRVHGIVANSLFDRVAGKAADTYPGNSPRLLMAQTVADIWNIHTEGRAIIIGQGSVARAAMPLAGHGACQVNGRPVIAISYNPDKGNWETNTDCYRPLPDYLKDATTRTLWDGGDGHWMGHAIADPGQVRRSALFSTFEIDSLIRLIENEPIGADAVTDLLMVNLKTPDYVGHQYGPDSPEMRDTLAALDRDFTRLLAALDAKAGKDRYVVAVSADHGMPAEPDARAGQERRYVDDVVKAIHAKFDPKQNGLIKQYEPENQQMVIDLDRLRALKLELAAIARFLETQGFVLAAYTEAEVASAVIPPR